MIQIVIYLDKKNSLMGISLNLEPRQQKVIVTYKYLEMFSVNRTIIEL